MSSLFKRFVSGELKTLNPSIKATVFKTALRMSQEPKVDFEFLWNLYKTTDSPDIKLSVLGTLGSVNDVDLVKKLLSLTLDSQEIKSQDVAYPISGSRENYDKVKVFDILWAWLKDNWPQLHESLAGSLSLLGHMIIGCCGGRIGHDFIQELKDWSIGKDCGIEQAELRVKQMEAVKRPLEQTLEKIANNTNWFERDNESLHLWSEQ